MGDSRVPKFVFVFQLILILPLFFFFVDKQSTVLSVSSLDLNIPLPVKHKQVTEDVPIVSARSALVMDTTSKTPLFAKNANFRFTPASATKIMTALVSLSYYREDDVLTIDSAKIPGSSMKLVPGERITVLSLLYGLLLNSGNDAAHTLARNYPGGIVAFVREMNALSQKLGLRNTSFHDPAGLSDDENFTTTFDLAKLATEALKNETFASIVATRQKTVFDVSGRTSHTLRNLNRLLWELPEVSGVKTGFTDRAGGVLVASVAMNGGSFVTVVFKSDDRFEDTKTLIEWALRRQPKKAR